MIRNLFAAALTVAILLPLASSVSAQCSSCGTTTAPTTYIQAPTVLQVQSPACQPAPITNTCCPQPVKQCCPKPAVQCCPPVPQIVAAPVSPCCPQANVYGPQIVEDDDDCFEDCINSGMYGPLRCAARCAVGLYPPLLGPAPAPAMYKSNASCQPRPRCRVRLFNRCR